MKLLDSYYWNTGGNCYCMDGAVENSPLGGGTVYFEGSTTATDVPMIWFFKTEELRDEGYEENTCAKYYGFDEPWIVELWKEAFHMAIKRAVHGWDVAVAKEDYVDFCKGYAEYAVSKELEELCK